MTKVILFDIDGLVLLPRKELPSLRFARELGLPKEAIEEFFLGNFKKCSMGQADLKEEVAPFLEKWKWPGSVDDFLKDWFEKDGARNEEVLQIVSALRAKGIKCYMATRQEKYRLHYFLENLRLKNDFDGVFCTCEIGYDKKQPEFWQYVLKNLGLEPSEVLYFDDSEKNVETARTLGIEAYFHEGDTFKNRIDQLLK